jgi:hypothetical protein
MNGMGALFYTTIINGKPEIIPFGSIWISDNFKTLNILVPDKPDKQTLSDLIISAPAKTREEAIKITKALNYKEFKF